MDTERIVKTENVYERVTNQIIEAIEAGAPVSSYRMPWHITDSETFTPANAVTKRPDWGVNALSLWLVVSVVARRGYTSGLWATYEQWKDLGAQVKRGEKSCVHTICQIARYNRFV